MPTHRPSDVTVPPQDERPGRLIAEPTASTTTTVTTKTADAIAKYQRLSIARSYSDTLSIQRGETRPGSGATLVPGVNVEASTPRGRGSGRRDLAGRAFDTCYATAHEQDDRRAYVLRRCASRW